MVRRDLFQLINDPLLLLGPNGRILDVTTSGSALLGHDRPALIGTRLAAILAPEAAATLTFHLNGSTASETRFRSIVTSQNGAERTLDFDARLLDDGNTCVCIRPEANRNSLTEATPSFEELSVDMMSDMVVWLDWDSRIVFANASALRHFRCTQRDIEAKTKKIYEIDPDFTEPVWRVHWREILEKRSMRFETVHKLSETEIVPVEVSVTSIEVGGEVYACAVFHDITHRKRLEAELLAAHADLQKLTITDPLSGISNRRHFDTRLDDEMRHHARTNAEFSLILLDVDMFKAYNDTYGHIAGDECLKRVAAALTRSMSRELDLVARYGGEEFVCLLPATSLAGAVKVAERIRAAIEALDIPHQSSSIAPHVTASMGVVSSACVPRSSATTLLAAADACLYEAKAKGRNCVVVYETSKAEQTADLARSA